MEGTIQNAAREIVGRRDFTIVLIMLMHLKFFAQNVLGMDFLVLDMVLVALMLFCIDYRRIRYSFFILIPWAAVSVINPGARGMLLIFLITYIVSELPLRAILWYNLVSQALVFCIVSILLLLGVTESVMFDQTAWDARIRYDFSMGNPNTFALFIYSFLINLYLYAGLRNRPVMWAILAVTLLVSKYTGSRTFMIAMALLFVVHVFRNMWKNHPKLSRTILLTMPAIMLSAVIYISLNYTDFPVINLLFTGRFRLYNMLMTTVSPMQTLVGVPDVNTMVIDNSFIHMLYEGGIIPVGVFFYLYYTAMIHSDGNDLSIMMPLLVSVFMVGLTENILTFALLFGNMIVWVILYKIYMGESISEMLEPEYEEDSGVSSL